MCKKTIKTILLIIVLGFGKSYCQDIKGAYIKTKWISGFTYEIKIYLFTDSSMNIIRPTIPVCLGGGANGTFSLSGITSGNGFNIKTYSGIHTYAGYGTYKNCYLDTFRIAGIKNILNSQTEQIYVESMLNINQFGGPNSSPPITFYPFNLGVALNQIYYNPGCVDPDGDSLSYSLVNCFAANYYLPNGSTLNNSTGTLSFSKDSIGLYAFSYKITEWRKDIDNNYNIVGTSQIDFVMDIKINVGINEINNENFKVSVYPNPVSNSLHIYANKNEIENSVIEIKNSLGQSSIKFPFTTDVDVTNLSVGYYNLTIIGKDKSIHTKFIKNN